MCAQTTCVRCCFVLRRPHAQWHSGAPSFLLPVAYSIDGQFVPSAVCSQLSVYQWQTRADRSLPGVVVECSVITVLSSIRAKWRTLVGVSLFILSTLLDWLIYFFMCTCFEIGQIESSDQTVALPMLGSNPTTNGPVAFETS